MLLLIGEMCVCDIENVLEMTQSKISRHVIYLKNNGIVKQRKNGVWVNYSLNLNQDSLEKEIIEIIGKKMLNNEIIKADRERYYKWIENKKCSL